LLPIGDSMVCALNRTDVPPCTDAATVMLPTLLATMLPFFNVSTFAMEGE